MTRKKDTEKISGDLKEAIKNQLLSSFKNRKAEPVDSVEYVNIMSIEIDDENEDRDKIIVTNVIAAARIWVKFVEDSKSSDNIQLRNNKPIEFLYNRDNDAFEMITGDVVFYNNSPY